MFQNVEDAVTASVDKNGDLKNPADQYVGRSGLKNVVNVKWT